ncbi:hypothetical protein FisN_10Lu430 [Fistulifera solaris]|uniref:Uncharacterized protein n=1 Tax=Fistulifera solaris TaxID=1519565 RepID=A0A1Z5JV51_FISSO|nr:hypothetical protein FisN_10Lu430 [Fistulifera solaris]|eukprot:GAX17712.1 hypothetical protein FisN_10Lu430 [Fistulifera solaris]
MAGKKSMMKRVHKVTLKEKYHAQYPLHAYSQKFQCFRLQRDPISLDEFEWKKYPDLVIEHENDTIICMCHCLYDKPDDEHGEKRELAKYSYNAKRVCFRIENPDRNYVLHCTVYGWKDENIAKTVTYFCSLNTPPAEGKPRSSLLIFDSEIIDRYDSDTEEYTKEHEFAFAAFRPDQLALIFDNNPKQYIELQGGPWTPEQSTIMATHPYSLDLSLSREFAFQDEGKAFVDALEKRESSFGSLTIYPDGNEAPLDRSNLKRLCKLETLDDLTIKFLDEECILDPFAAKVDFLEYTTHGNPLLPNSFDSLEIGTKKLNFRLYLDGVKEWD